MMLPMMGRSPMAEPAPVQYPRPVSPMMPTAPTTPIQVGPEQGFTPPQPIRPLGRPILGQFHKGGKVPRTGAYQLKKGEHVIAKGHRKMVNHAPQKLESVAALRA